MAEKQLLQARLKSINSLLDNNAKQLELTRSKIASILTPHNYKECQEFIEKIKEKRFIKVRQRQVRKLNNLINKKEGNITWQSSQVLPATRASPWVNNRQAGNRVQAGNSIQACNSIQAGRLALISSPQASQPSSGERALPQSLFSQAGSSQVFLEDNTFSPAESELSHASNSQASLADSTLSLAESDISQAGSSQASLEDSTLSPAESVLSQTGSSQASPVDSTLSPAESKLPGQQSPGRQFPGFPQ